MASLNIWQCWKLAAILISLYGMCSEVGAEHRADGGKSRVSIVGGTASQPNKWPMYAFMQVDAGGGMAEMCGGSIIAPRWVLTASHCLTSPDVSAYQILVGVYNITQVYEQDVITAQQIIKHPNYVDAGQGDDIGLIYLSKAVQYSSIVQPVALPTAEPAVGSTCTVMGFGTMKFQTDQTSNILREVDVPIVSNDDCSVALSTQMLTSQLCAGGVAGKDSCQGDSGGPILCKNSNQKYEVSGVVSYGVGCGDAGSPGVYARVSSYLPWIDEVMKSQPN